MASSSFCAVHCFIHALLQPYYLKQKIKLFFSVDFAAYKSLELASSCSFWIWDVDCFWFTKPDFILLHIPISAVSQPQSSLPEGAAVTMAVSSPEHFVSWAELADWPL